tara:strand:- start:479 stop:1873 length:1395 start_codon:yes stop_codon:yes gene_type:complete
MFIILIKYYFFTVYFLSNVYALNLTFSDYHNPTAHHILDAEVIDDILIISAMVQGIEFYDISNSGDLNHLTNFSLSSGGGGWGGGTKSNCVRAKGNYAYFTSSNGLYVVNITNPSNPQSLGSVAGTNNLNLENLDLHQNILAVCAHTDGVLLYDISNPSNPIYKSTFNTENAWAVSVSSEFMYIADNNLIRIVNINDINNPAEYGYIETGNAVKDLSIKDAYLYVALGTDGINIYNIELLQEPIFLSNYNTNTMANRISVFDNKVAVADWDDIEVIEWNGQSLIQVGYKNTGNRTMAVATKDQFIYSAEWASVQVFEFGVINGPDIDLSTLELNYPYVENNFSYSMQLDVINNGNQIAEIIDNYLTNSDFSIVTPLSNLDPGEKQTIEIVYNATNANASGSYRIFSNDLDEYEIICETNGNIDGANVGEIAPDFELEYVANGEGTFKLSDHIDEIIVIAFFAPN